MSYEATFGESYERARGRSWAVALLAPVAWQGLALAGLLTVFIGLGIDAWVHNSGRAGEEDLLSLTNPGHAISGAGLGVTLIGLLASVTLTAARATGMSFEAMRPLAIVAAAWVVCVAVAIGVVAYVAASGTTVGHSHGDGAAAMDAHPGDAHGAVAVQGHDGTMHDHGAHPTFSAIVASSGDDLLGEFPSGMVLKADLPVLRDQLRAASAAAAEFPTVAAAKAAGFTLTTTDVDYMGLHYLSVERVADGVFDPARPEGLLFSRIDGAEPTLVGVWYFQAPGVGPVSFDVAPEGFAGDLDYWHGHKNVCLPFETEGGTEADCVAQGGRFITDTRWMMHAWVVSSADDNPDGVFAYLNNDLHAAQVAARGSDPDSDGDGLRDSVELRLGLNPILADSDDDGVADGRDVRWLGDVIEELPEGALATLDAGERPALMRIADEAASALAGGDASRGIAALGELRARLDGCTVHAGGADWMRACDARAEAAELIDLFLGRTSES